MRDGAIGEVRRVQAELSYRRNESAESRFFRPELGGGAALDLGVYPLSLALHFLGRPAKVSGRWQASKSGVDMRSEFSLDFVGGAKAELACGFDRDGGNQFVIEGSEGVLVLDAPFLKAQRLLRFSPKPFAMMPSEGSGILAKLARRLPLPGRHVQHFPFPGNGLQFEAAAVMEDAVRGGRDGSDHAAEPTASRCCGSSRPVLRGSPSVETISYRLRTCSSRT